MRISEILPLLEKVKEKYGDLQVRLETDHAQVPMLATDVLIAKIEEETFMPDYTSSALGVEILVIEAY